LTWKRGQKMTVAGHGFSVTAPANAREQCNANPDQVGGTRERLRAGSFVSCSRATMASSSDPVLFDLVQAYSALKHPRLLSFPSRLPFPQVHDFVLSYILFNPHLSQYPPSYTYQLSFWKWVIEQLEILLGDEAGALLPFTTLRITST
jgi:hypothetical protein